MAIFESADDLYKTVGAFLADLMQDPEIGPQFTKVGITLLACYTDPDSRILLDCSSAPPTVTTDPPADTVADVTLTMDADAGHKFWLGEYNVAYGLAKRKIKISGSAGTMMKLIPAMAPAFDRYRDFLVANGHADKLV